MQFSVKYKIITISLYLLEWHRGDITVSHLHHINLLVVSIPGSELTVFPTRNQSAVSQYAQSKHAAFMCTLNGQTNAIRAFKTDTEQWTTLASINLTLWKARNNEQMRDLLNKAGLIENPY